MSDYIKRESAKEVLLYNWDESCSYAIEDLERIPAEDVMPLVTGHWTYGIEIYDENTWYCSVCDEPWTLNNEGTPKENNMNFCPNCGAKMEG